MTDKEKLKIYDQLREAHKYIKVLDTRHMEEYEVMVIEAVDGVLYMAEAHFGRMSD